MGRSRGRRWRSARAERAGQPHAPLAPSWARAQAQMTGALRAARRGPAGATASEQRRWRRMVPRAPEEGAARSSPCRDKASRLPLVGAPERSMPLAPGPSPKAQPGPGLARRHQRGLCPPAPEGAQEEAAWYRQLAEPWRHEAAAAAAERTPSRCRTRGRATGAARTIVRPGRRRVVGRGPLTRRLARRRRGRRGGRIRRQARLPMIRTLLVIAVVPALAARFPAILPAARPTAMFAPLAPRLDKAAGAA